ncbi:TPA: hypothetical protein JLK36_002247 [Escherichia coli]|nr:hypothetical protein [Escherichia coli]
MKKDIQNYFFTIIIFCLPLILANFYYIDDNGRAIEGYTNWGIDGRPLADALMRAITMSSRLVDLHPLNLLISSLVLAVSFSFLKHENDHKGNYLMSFFPPLFLIFNFFYLEILSYRFDSITISIAVACALFASTFRYNNKQNFLITFLSSLAMLCLYQTTINILLIVSMCNFVVFCNKESNTQKIIKKLLIKLVALFTSLIIYTKIIIPMSFSGNHSANHPGVNESLTLSGIFQNTKTMLSVLCNGISKHSGEQLLIILFILSMIAVVTLIIRNKEINIFIRIMILLSPIFAFISIFGVLLTLDHILFSPRVYIAYGAFLYFTAIVSILALPERLKKLSFIYCLIILHSLILSYAYGNMLKTQDDRNKLLASSIANDIGNTTTMKLVFNGTYPLTEENINTLRSFPQLRLLLPNYFANWWWTFQYFKRNGYNFTYPGPVNLTDIVKSKKLCEPEPSRQNNKYNIYIVDDIALIDFTKKLCE